MGGGGGGVLGETDTCIEVVFSFTVGGAWYTLCVLRSIK